MLCRERLSVVEDLKRRYRNSLNELMKLEALTDECMCSVKSATEFLALH